MSHGMNPDSTAAGRNNPCIGHGLKVIGDGKIIKDDGHAAGALSDQRDIFHQQWIGLRGDAKGAHFRGRRVAKIQ